MAITKANFKILVQQLIDDPDGRWWSTANLDLLAGIVYDDRWQELLTFSPRYVSQMDELTSLTAPGYIRLAKTTDTPAGDLSQRFFRIQSIIRDTQEYSPIDPRWVVIQDDVVQAVSGGNNYKYFRQGPRLYLFPFDLTADIEFRYSYLPATYASLASGDLLSWPDGHENVLIYETVSRLMLKGGQEIEASREFRMEANRLMRECVAIAERVHAGPFTITPSDTAQAWGGA